MELKGSFRVKQILKPTKAKLFSHLQVGDEITIIKKLGKEGRYTRSNTGSYITIKDNHGNTVQSTLRMVGNILPCFEWEEL